MRGALKKLEEYLSRGDVGELMLSASRVVVAFSGGADSAFLLCLLADYLKGTGITLEAAHLNHMIRGDEAYRDEDFCRRRAEELGITLHLKRCDVPALSKQTGMSTEAAARMARYAFFEEICEKGDGKTVIATAHNADDNLETVIFNLLRGSGARGMCGIPPARDDKYVRPILPFTGREIRELCRECGIDYVYDSTNGECEYSRNRIRHLVVPELEKLAASPQLSVLRMTDSLRADADYLDGLAAEVPLAEDGSATAEELSALPYPVLSRVILKMYESLSSDKNTGEHPHLEHVHVREIISQLKSANKSLTLDVPGTLVFFKKDGKCGFRQSREPLCATVTDASESELVLDGEATVKNGYEIRLLSENGFKKMKDLPQCSNIYNLSIHTTLRFDKIRGKLFVRCRREGDSYRYGGMTRRLKKLLNEKHIPAEERERLPIICDGEGILWIPGFPIRDGVTSGDGEVVYVVCRRIS